MDYRVLLSDRALTDLQRIVETIAEDNPRAAQSIGEALIDHIMGLADFPLMGVRCPEHPETRVLLHTPYRIIYRVHQGRRLVEILTIWHSARQEPSLNG
ncbi:MAG: type II toxin-antitoxin system RelE/ParE family toxin [Terriglobia bacterium]